MKKIIFSMLLTASVAGASAMPIGHVGGGFRGGRTVIISGGFYNPFYSPFGFYYGYPPFSPFATVQKQPSKLDMQVDGIKQDCKDKIKSVKMDKSLSKQERKEKIKDFKAERDQEIYDAKRNYYKQ